MAKVNISINDAKQVTGNETSIVVAVGDVLEWIDGPDGKRRPGNRTGTQYTVLMQQSECAHLVVRTQEAAPVVSAEAVAEACLSGQFIHIRFEGFSATPYQGKNGLGISAKADKAILVSGPVVGKKEMV